MSLKDWRDLGLHVLAGIAMPVLSQLVVFSPWPGAGAVLAAFWYHEWRQQRAGKFPPAPPTWWPGNWGPNGKREFLGAAIAALVISPPIALWWPSFAAGAATEGMPSQVLRSLGGGAG